MNKDLDPNVISTITTNRTQEHGETSKSTRFINSKEQTAAGNITDPEEYTTPLPLLLEEEEGSGIKIQRHRRIRTASDTDNQPRRKHNTTHRKNIANVKRKLESPEDREESKNRRKTEEESERRKA